jgi:aldehyde:ferredoxin oxidoreductase
MKYYGYAGTVLYVDLTRNSVRKEPLELEMISNFVGGLGIDSKLAYDLIKPGVDPLSPENVLIYGAGPFVGTLIPGFSRNDVISKSPQTGFLAQSGTGISIGAMLKYAGYDHLVITGRAEKPVYLVITDDLVEVKDASDLWGMDLLEATDVVRSKLGNYWVSCIGPAGERLVRFACIIDNKNGMSARTGLGAVMGSKNLKAIAVRGTKGIKVHQMREFRKSIDELRQAIKASPLIDPWRNEGKIIDPYIGAYTARGISLTKNFAQGFPEATTDFFTQKEYADRIWKVYYACLGCPVGDKAVDSLRGGKYAGLTLKLSNPWGTPLGFNICGVRNWDDGVKCADMANRYGIDIFTATNLMAWAIELYEKGILTRKDTDGLELKWDSDTVMTLMDKIARREGIGDILAEGEKISAQRIGRNSARYAVNVKGLEPTMDLRETIFTENFGQLVDPRGAHHARGYGITYIPRKAESIARYAPRIGVPADAVARICPEPGVFSVPRLTKWVQDYDSLAYSLGMCMRVPIGTAYDLATITRLYSITTGIESSSEELLKAGERIWNIQRLFNEREGATRKDDMPPPRMLNEPVTVGDAVHQPIKESYIQQLLNEYYDERGWDTVTGNPTEQKLIELGLKP